MCYVCHDYGVFAGFLRSSDEHSAPSGLELDSIQQQINKRPGLLLS